MKAFVRTRRSRGRSAARNVQSKRVAKAFSLVVGLVCLVPMSGLARGGASGQVPSSSIAGGISASEIICGLDMHAMLDRLEDAGGLNNGKAPAYFEREIGVIEGARDVRASGDERIVGYIMDCPATQAQQRVSQWMMGRGWTEVSLGSVSGATFVKKGGDCRWALASCTQVGSATSVVYRCAIT